MFVSMCSDTTRWLRQPLQFNFKTLLKWCKSCSFTATFNGYRFQLLAGNWWNLLVRTKPKTIWLLSLLIIHSSPKAPVLFYNFPSSRKKYIFLRVCNVMFCVTLNIGFNTFIDLKSGIKTLALQQILLT